MNRKTYIFIVLFIGLVFLIYHKNNIKNANNKASQNSPISMSQNTMKDNDFGVLIEKKELSKPSDNIQNNQDKNTDKPHPIISNLTPESAISKNNEIDNKIKEIENNYRKKWAIIKGDQYTLDAANKYRDLEKKLILMFLDYYTCRAAINDDYKECDNLSKFKIENDLVKGNKNFVGCRDKLTNINFAKFINKLSDKISHCSNYYRDAMIDNEISLEKFCDISRNSDIKDICKQFKSEKKACEKYTSGSCDKKDAYCLSFWDFNRAFKTGNPSVSLIESQNLVIAVINNNCSQIANNIIMEYNSLENLMDTAVFELKMKEQTNKYQQEMGKKVKQKKGENEGE